jgi:predicted phage baseplate assembly protein
VFPFQDPPVAVVSGRTRLVLDNGVDPPQPDWEEVLEWDRSGAHDRHFRVVPERGELQSGDGLRAEVIPAGYALRVSYQEGGGDAGNIAAATLTAVPASTANIALAPPLAGFAQPLAVSQPFEALGGCARETLHALEKRAYDNAALVDKAVTVEDFERLAAATPGVPVARVYAIPGLYAAMPCYPAPGLVTLIVVPDCPRPAPLPSRALLDAVLRYIGPRRLVTCEVHAMAPSYRRIGVYATLQLACNADPADVRARALAAVDAFLDPLDGGPDRNGWPIGRTVYRTEVLALLADVEGVLRAIEFGLRGPGDSAPRCGNVELCPHELAMPGHHELQLAAALPNDLTRSDAHACEPC